MLKYIVTKNFIRKRKLVKFNNHFKATTVSNNLKIPSKYQSMYSIKEKQCWFREKIKHSFVKTINDMDKIKKNVDVNMFPVSSLHHIF